MNDPSARMAAAVSSPAPVPVYMTVGADEAGIGVSGPQAAGRPTPLPVYVAHSAALHTLPTRPPPVPLSSSA